MSAPGPFKFVAADIQPGVKIVYERNTDYVPRSEPASVTSGGKSPSLDRVEWLTMRRHAQTAVNALNSGEIDYIEAAADRLATLMAANSGGVIDVFNKLGQQTMGR